MGDAAVIHEAQVKRDYSLTGSNSKLAVEKGLAEADWYQCEVESEVMRGLLQRRNRPAIRDTVLWFTLIIGIGWIAALLWGSWWFLLPYLAYCALYASTSDSRWHESLHGTAFRTDWMNSVLYEIASFMLMRESVEQRWSHIRHHSDTIIVGRDPEIIVPRPPDIRAMVLSLFGLASYPRYFYRILLHSSGRTTARERTFIPVTEFPGLFVRARIYVVAYAFILALSAFTGSILPLLYVGLVNLFGSWLLLVYALTQHTGLAENVLDHRLNCRTVYMCFIHRYLYWNMNYHLEHHMFPLVPYHALPRLHDVVKDDCPPPYPSLLSAWREIVPAVLRQRKDPAYFVKRALPPPKPRAGKKIYTARAEADAEGWVDACPAAELLRASVSRFDYGRKTLALYRDGEGTIYATDGMCTHSNAHLADGLVKGKLIECAKHNGRFSLPDGSPARAPICRGLVTYPAKEKDGRILVNLLHPGGAGAREQTEYRFRVVSNRSVATFIKELVLDPMQGPCAGLRFLPGDYLQFKIPAYESICFRDFEIPEPYASVWEARHVFDLVARNPETGRHNNYSLASNAETEETLRFNVRIATPPPGQQCAPGAGSSYMFSLKTGDVVTAIGPFGDFHIKPTQREMIYIGGGAGMAPLRAHISHLLETDSSARSISYWYGARSRQEIFYDDYFEALACEHRNFSFHIALSSPLPEDEWTGDVGLIHDVVRDGYLKVHPNPAAAEYYLCGPPMMIRACLKLLAEADVPPAHIAFDEF